LTKSGIPGKNKMPRPVRFGRVRRLPDINYFTPRGVKKLEELTLTVVEFEAIRLKDSEGLDQIEAAKKMNISQPTFNRVLSSARKKVADAIVNGKAIKIKGGNYVMAGVRGIDTRLGRGRMGGFGLGPSGECICPNCGTRAPHQRGIPCYKQKCPKCGTLMTRA
jgi:predicted DNA-binding protein (UPF0251 family)